jgi:salicylate hydroxylase
MEDAVSIATLLHKDTQVHEIPALLKLYDEIRRDRVDYIQEQARRNGLDNNKGKPPRKFRCVKGDVFPPQASSLLTTKPAAFLFAMLDFCFKHDEYENTLEHLQQWRQVQAKTLAS